MYIVDHPMLALITRFHGDHEQLDISDHEFLREQASAIEKHVRRFPANEQQKRALEWVEAKAREQRAFARRAGDERRDTRDVVKQGNDSSTGRDVSHSTDGSVLS